MWYYNGDSYKGEPQSNQIKLNLPIFKYFDHTAFIALENAIRSYYIFLNKSCYNFVGTNTHSRDLGNLRVTAINSE